MISQIMIHITIKNEQMYLLLQIQLDIVPWNLCNNFLNPYNGHYIYNQMELCLHSDPYRKLKIIYIRN